MRRRSTLDVGPIQITWESMNYSGDEDDGVPEQSRTRSPYECCSSHEKRAYVHARDRGQLCLPRLVNGSGVENIMTIIMQNFKPTVCHTEGRCIFYKKRT